MSQAAPSEPSPARVVLYTRPGCHLCHDARATVASVCAELGVSFTEVDISADPELTARYGEEIPVTMLDGRQHDFWRVDPDRLRSALLAPHRADPS